MSDILNDLVILAHEWADYGHELQVSGHEEIIEGVVKLYRAVDSDHRTATFGQYPHQITVALFSPEKIEGTVMAHKHICATMRAARQALDEHKARRAARDEKEKEDERLARVAKPKEELEKLGVAV